jgi:hypothetical protein
MTSGYLNRAKSDVVELADKSLISTPRVIAAFVFTPLLVSLAVAFALPFYPGLPDYLERVLRTWPFYIIFGALPPTAIFGIPAFLIFKKLVRVSVWSCAGVGAIIAAFPWFLLGLFPTGSAWTAGRATIINGHYTTYGWLEFAGALFVIASAGAVGGIIFWMIAVAKWPRGQS